MKYSIKIWVSVQKKRKNLTVDTVILKTLILLSMFHQIFPPSKNCLKGYNYYINALYCCHRHTFVLIKTPDLNIITN